MKIAFLTPEYPYGEIGRLGDWETGRWVDLDGIVVLAGERIL